jgi:hypothetical protein
MRQLALSFISLGSMVSIVGHNWLVQGVQGQIHNYKILLNDHVTLSRQMMIHNKQHTLTMSVATT